MLDGRETSVCTEVTLDEHVQGTVGMAVGLDTGRLWMMAAACGLAAANLVYAQPLLAKMGQSFAVPASQIGLVPTLGQIGYALGLILIVPLGEKYQQRRLFVLLCGAAALALLCMATAATLPLLVLASGLVGFTSVVPEVLIPLAARLARPGERGRVVGTMIGGFLVGTPLASVLSGLVGEHLGWRGMYWLAAATMVGLAIVLRCLLPDDHSAKKAIGYFKLLHSLWDLLREEPVLQEVSVLGILVSAAFSVFWVSLSFMLGAPPYRYGSDMVGIFGLVGLGGAGAAFYVGRLVGHKTGRRGNGWALAMALLAFIVMWATGLWLIGLIVGALLLDVGVQSHQVVNETRLYGLHAAAWNRLSAIYIFLFCIGSACGSALGTFAWGVAQWNGVYGSGCCLLLVALGFYVLHGGRMRRWEARIG